MSKDCGKFRRGQVWMYVDRDSLYNGTPAPGPMVGSRPVVIISEDDYNDSESWSVVCRELLRLIEVGASCFNHYCAGYDDT